MKKNLLVLNHLNNNHFNISYYNNNTIIDMNFNPNLENHSEHENNNQYNINNRSLEIKN